MIQSLSIPGDTFSSYYLFLFEAVHYLDASLYLREDAKIGLTWPSEHDEQGLQDWEKHAGGQLDEEPSEWVDPGPKFLQNARFDLEFWDDNLNFDALYSLDYDLLPALIHSSPPSPYPFSSLIHLAMKCSTPLDCLLVFYTSSFPRLETLSLYSDFEFGPGDELEWATLRFSITREKGVGINYAADNDDASILKPLSENEMLEYPLKPYRGPNLRRLELSLT
ncbi:uncharacterized protein JCM6883_001356 [Sporobolomyces salmoneus]|uniref:uncharacterized protein n=1 Tax=Sporobolomyces salmoneus TaxID=183962 RepID=UPI00316BF399